MSNVNDDNNEIELYQSINLSLWDRLFKPDLVEQLVQKRLDMLFAGEKAKLAEEKAKLAVGKNELAKGQAELAKEQAKLAVGKKELADGKARLAEEKAKLAQEQALANDRFALAKGIAAYSMERQNKAEKVIEIFRKHNGIEPEVPDSAINRDKHILVELNKIREDAENLVKQKKVIDNIKYSEIDTRNIYNSYQELLCKLLGIVAVYRDLLADNETPSCIINGKTVNVFLSDLANETQIGILLLKSEDRIKLTEDAYCNIAKDLGFKPREDDNVNPFDADIEKLKLRDRIGYSIYCGAKNGADRIFDLVGRGGKEGKTGRTKPIGEPTQVEEDIGEIIGSLHNGFGKTQKSNTKPIGEPTQEEEGIR